MNFEEGEILLFNKPKGWTSFDVVNKVRYLIKRNLNIKKIKVGHAGTLDPLATGLLLIATGKATKNINTLQGLDKTYEGIIHLGATTPSFDLETEIDREYDISSVTEEDIIKAAKSFQGETEQVPPVYSAIKHKGTAMYKLARKGEAIEPKSRKVQIYKFEITKIGLPEIHFLVKCSKGTYIRSLAFDFGRALGSGAYLAALCRTEIGSYKLKDAWEIKEFEEKLKGER